MSYKCIRCEDLFSVSELSERCPRAPDRGPHETFDVRQGFSLHVAACPRSDPSPFVRSLCRCPRAGVPIEGE